MVLTFTGAASAAGDDAPEDPVVTVTVLWLMPTPDGGWPQTLTTGRVCATGAWAREAVYTGPQSLVAAILEDAHADEGEDVGVLVSERVVPMPPCEPAVPPAAPADPAPAPPSFAG